MGLSAAAFQRRNINVFSAFIAVADVGKQALKRFAVPSQSSASCMQEQSKTSHDSPRICPRSYRSMMSMFDTFGKATDTSGRKENTLRKLERLNKALRHEEPDRVPDQRFFLGRLHPALAQGTRPARLTPIRITTTTWTGLSPCRTWTRGSARSRRSRRRRRRSW